jgi:hypothetical protein
LERVALVVAEMPIPRLHEALVKALDSVVEFSRPAFLNVLESSWVLVEALGGKPALESVAKSIEKVQRWWP